jgi:hypothetical protein
MFSLLVLVVFAWRYIWLCGENRISHSLADVEWGSVKLRRPDCNFKEKGVSIFFGVSWFLGVGFVGYGVECVDCFVGVLVFLFGFCGFVFEVCFVF